MACGTRPLETLRLANPYCINLIVLNISYIRNGTCVCACVVKCLNHKVHKKASPGRLLTCKRPLAVRSDPAFVLIQYSHFVILSQHMVSVGMFAATDIQARPSLAVHNGLLEPIDLDSATRTDRPGLVS